MELAEIEMRNLREEERQEQSKALVYETLEREQRAIEQMKLKNDSDQELPDDEDYSDDDDEEFNTWKVRELERLKRDQQIQIEQEKLEKEKSERAKMSDSQIEEENMKLGLKKSLREKGEMKFMQKYYHGGAFFHDGDLVDQGLVGRDITAATGQDRSVDRSILPKVLQVKDFGKKGRTKCKF
jgi:microfibrillar-associated protein 1